MKRSQINQAIRDLLTVAEECRFALPPFVHWTPEQWREKAAHADHIRAAQLGWDVTDYGSGDFQQRGLTLITLRNGLPGDDSTKPYCEKIMLVGENQVTPFHFHYHKTEDIINRGGGTLVLEVHSVDRNQPDQLGDGPVELVCDGMNIKLKPGQHLELAPGESVTFKPYTYHTFSAKVGAGPVLAGEVSKVNDDENDNHFLEDVSRFPQIDEDQPPFRLLCNEYPRG